MRLGPVMNFLFTRHSWESGMNIQRVAPTPIHARLEPFGKPLLNKCHQQTSASLYLFISATEQISTSVCCLGPSPSRSPAPRRPRVRVS